MYRIHKEYIIERKSRQNTKSQKKIFDKILISCITL